MDSLLRQQRGLMLPSRGMEFSEYRTRYCYFLGVNLVIQGSENKRTMHSVQRVKWHSLGIYVAVGALCTWDARRNKEVGGITFTHTL